MVLLDSSCARLLRDPSELGRLGGFGTACEVPEE
jgi:hypothetical protein